MFGPCGAHLSVPARTQDLPSRGAAVKDCHFGRPRGLVLDGCEHGGRAGSALQRSADMLLIGETSFPRNDRDVCKLCAASVRPLSQNAFDPHLPLAVAACVAHRRTPRKEGRYPIRRSRESVGGFAVDTMAASLRSTDTFASDQRGRSVRDAPISVAMCLPQVRGHPPRHR